MSSNDNANLIYALALLVFVASGLFARRIPMGQMAKYALAWIGLFGVGFVLFSFRGEAARVWRNVRAEFSPDTPQLVDGTVRIKRGEDGHFHVNAEINGHEVRLLIDSGATVTSLSETAARAASIQIDESGFPVVIDTANGMTEAKRASIQRLVIGPMVRADFPVHVSDSFGDTNMLGMNFLDTLKSWRVEGDTMVLNP